MGQIAESPRTRVQLVGVGAHWEQTEFVDILLAPGTVHQINVARLALGGERLRARFLVARGQEGVNRKAFKQPGSRPDAVLARRPALAFDDNDRLHVAVSGSICLGGTEHDLVALPATPLPPDHVLDVVASLVGPGQQYAAGIATSSRGSGPVPVAHALGAARCCRDDLGEPVVLKHAAFAWDRPLLELSRRAVGT